MVMLFPNILVFTQVVFLHSFPVLVFSHRSQQHYRPKQAALTVFRGKKKKKKTYSLTFQHQTAELAKSPRELITWWRQKWS